MAELARQVAVDLALIEAPAGSLPTEAAVLVLAYRWVSRATSTIPA